MEAMVLDRPGQPLERRTRPTPKPTGFDILIEVTACGVCRTDLHVVDGDLAEAKLPLVPGHEVVGRVVETGPGVDAPRIGDRVGIPWLGHTCGACPYCTSGHENLCDAPGFTGYTRDGGYAEYVCADARYCFPLGSGIDDVSAAPLLCAGLIGYRSLRFAGDAGHIGLYGFGAAAHIIAQVIRYQGRRFSAFVRPGDDQGSAFAMKLGASWAGVSTEAPPEPLDAAILFAPVGELVPESLKRVRKGGTVVCAGIHMSDIPSFPYRDLWEERRIVSVANLTRRDGVEFLDLAAKAGVTTEVTTYPLAEANIALDDLRNGAFNGAAVLVP